MVAGVDFPTQRRGQQSPRYTIIDPGQRPQRVIQGMVVVGPPIQRLRVPSDGRVVGVVVEVMNFVQGTAVLVDARRSRGSRCF